MARIKKLSLNSYSYKMNFKKEYIYNFKLDLLSILYITSLNILKQDKEDNIKLTKRVQNVFLYLNTLTDYKDTRPEEDKERFKEALFDEFNALKDLYVDFNLEDLYIEDFNEWLEEQK